MKTYDEYQKLLDMFLLDFKSVRFKNIEANKARFIQGLKQSGECYIDPETRVESFNRLAIETALDFGIRMGYNLFNQMLHYGETDVNDETENSKFGPKCDACVDFYQGECNCQRSVFVGMSMPNLPWEGCSCFLSLRKWGKNSKTKRKKKHPSLEEFEFGV